MISTVISYNKATGVKFQRSPRKLYQILYKVYNISFETTSHSHFDAGPLPARGYPDLPDFSWNPVGFSWTGGG
jgi:hypothetical protein